LFASPFDSDWLSPLPLIFPQFIAYIVRVEPEKFAYILERENPAIPLTHDPLLDFVKSLLAKTILGVTVRPIFLNRVLQNRRQERLLWSEVLAGRNVSQYRCTITLSSIFSVKICSAIAFTSCQPRTYNKSANGMPQFRSCILCGNRFSWVRNPLRVVLRAGDADARIGNMNRVANT
jgi:hypothetical protein